MGDRVAVVTGGARGIGLAIAEAFLREGTDVAVWDPNANNAEFSHQSAGGSAALELTRIDIRDRSLVMAEVARLRERKKKVDILVNNAGVTPGFVELAKVSDEIWTTVLGTNLEGALHCAQALAPDMCEQGWGRIINLSSVFARRGFRGQSAYSASKAGIESLTRVWAREFGPFGVTVNAISPGYIDTPMNRHNSERMVQQVIAGTPAGRLGQPAEVAELCLFLCSRKADFINGAVIPVDGGLTA